MSHGDLELKGKTLAHLASVLAAGLSTEELKGRGPRVCELLEGAMHA